MNAQAPVPADQQPEAPAAMPIQNYADFYRFYLTPQYHEPPPACCGQRRWPVLFF